MKKNFFTLFIIILSFPTFAFAFNPNQNNEQVLPLPKVDKRVELLCIVFRLAGNFEYNAEDFKTYVGDIHAHFDKYKDHPVVKFAKELSDSNGVSFDAVIDLAVYLDNVPNLKPIIPFDNEQLDQRWGVENANKFVPLLQQFYVDAQCEEFFNQHNELYKLAEERFKTVYNAFDINWYKQYYGTTNSGSFNIVIALGNGGCNYGSKIIYPDGKENAYAIMGTWSFDSTGNPFYNPDSYLSTLIHEFNHSFVNHLIDKFEKELEQAGTILYAPLQSTMQRQAYSNSITMLKESLVRSSVVRYLKSHNTDNKIFENEISAQIGNGFLWTKLLNDKLEFYENNRKQYPTLESFMPNIVTFFDSFAKDYSKLLDKCPKVISIEPFSNNAKDVSPDIKEMKIIFDQPLTGKGHSIWYGLLGQEHYPIIKMGASYSDNNKALLLKLDLKPSTEYEFILVGQAYKTVEDFPLLNYVVSFKTK